MRALTDLIKLAGSGVGIKSKLKYILPYSPSRLDELRNLVEAIIIVGEPALAKPLAVATLVIAWAALLGIFK